MVSLIEIAALVLILYLIHRSFHKVNFFGFLLVSGVLILSSIYMDVYMHVQPAIALLLPIILFPISQALVHMSIKSLRHEKKPPPQMVMLPPYR